jgi:hypothetical protein
MIEQSNFTSAHIKALHNRYPLITVQVFEMAMCAFGLLQALVDSGLPFIFKGGTCLLLLLKQPQRISTDIDILVDPKIDLRPYLEKIGKRFPFHIVRGIERNLQDPIDHFSFPVPKIFGTYDHAVRLDVLREKSPYLKLEQVPLRSPLLLASGVDCFVAVPSLECLLADKLTAFAPKTIGVDPERTSAGVPMNNHLQVVKQLFDIGVLFEEARDFETLQKTYRQVARSESLLRGGTISESQALRDSFEAAFCVATGGAADNSMYRRVFRSGIASLHDHIFEGGYNAVLAKKNAANAMLLSAGLLSGCNVLTMAVPPQKGFQELPHQAIKEIKESLYFNRAAYAIRLIIPGL